VGEHTVFVERPAIVPVHGRALVIGPRAFVSDSAGRAASPLQAPGNPYVERFDEIPMGALSDGYGVWDWVSEPPRARSMPWLPRAAVDSDGVAHIVWASSDSAVDETPPAAPSIWYARFDGTRWTDPLRVGSDRRYYWSSSTVSPLVMRGRTLHFVVSTKGEGLTYFHSVGAGWSAQHVGISNLYYGYPGLAVLPSGRLVLVSQGPSKRGRPGWGESGVFATRSDDGGVAWSAPVLVSTADGEPAYDHQLLLDGNGALHAIWFQQTDSLGNPALHPNLGNSPGRVHVAESVDGGITWRQLAPSALLQNADGLVSMVGDDGSLIVALADRVDERLLLTTWKGSWRPFARIPAAPNPGHPALGRGDAQRPVLTWGTRGPHGRVITMMTMLTTCS
ncbi:MAG TPA: sialidase family protein, partial [Acidimicrobiia bacterium]|nr:sialidase family protein [Acidimicrobiia bacterium]